MPAFSRFAQRTFACEAPGSTRSWPAAPDAPAGVRKPCRATTYRGPAWMLASAPRLRTANTTPGNSKDRTCPRDSGPASEQAERHASRELAGPSIAPSPPTSSPRSASPCHRRSDRRSAGASRHRTGDVTPVVCPETPPPPAIDAGGGGKESPTASALSSTAPRRSRSGCTRRRRSASRARSRR